MIDDLPAPLVPSDVDLRDFPFVPIDVARLFNSTFHARANDAEWRAGMTLWLKSFHQVPAASLPDDDVTLCRLAELGRDQRTWNKVRAVSLHGWVKCSDGLFYHPVVAEKALEGWLEKLQQRKSSAAGNAKRWGAQFDPEAIEIAVGTAAALLTALNPQSRMLRKFVPKQKSWNPGQQHSGVPTGRKKSPAGNPDRVPSGSQETGKGQGRDINSDATHRAAPPPLACDPIPLNLIRIDDGDWSKPLFRQALAWVSEQSGKPPEKLRSFLGQCLKAAGHDHKRVFDLIARAQAEAIAEPQAWVMANLGAAAARPNRIADDEFNRRVAEKLAAAQEIEDARKN